MRGQLTQVEGKNLPGEAYLSIVGSFSHISAGALHHHPIDNRHVYLWVLEPNSGLVYECAVHTRLTYESRMQICLFKELISVASWPDLGIYSKDPSLSYQGLQLDCQDFIPVGRRSLSDELHGFAVRADRIQVYGVSNSEGNGIHDIHQNTGEPPHRTRINRPGQDGALIFYYAEKPGIPAHRLWMCLKFEEQAL